MIRCDRCQRRLRNINAAAVNGWNCIARNGDIVGYVCSDCQTPEENAEAEIRYATLDYRCDAFGNITTRPKGTTP
jgi:hypothetical protein